MELNALIGAVILPTALAAVALFLVRAARGRAPWFGSTALPALVLAGAVVLAARHQAGGLFWPPRIALDSLPWVAACAALVACVLREGQVPWAGPAGMRGRGGSISRADAEHERAGAFAPVVAAALPCVAALSLLQLPGAGAGAELRLAGVAVAAIAAGAAAAACARPGPASPIAMWGTAAGLAGLAMLASIAKLALIMGAFSATAAAIAVLSLVQRPLALGSPGAAVWVSVMSAAAFLGMAYDEAGLPVFVWWVAAASPVASALALIPAIARRPRCAAVVRAMAPIAVIAVCVAAAAASLATTDDGNDGGSEPAYDSYSLHSTR